MKFACLMMIPALAAGGAGAAEEEIEAVAAGKKVFESIGCAECHTVGKADQSVKTGPNLYGLFLTEARDREVVVGGEKTVVKADRDYYDTSIRKSLDQLAVSEKGATKGTAYPPNMPSYVEEVLSNDDLDYVWHYLRTLADKGQSGPSKVILKREKAEEITDPLEIPGEELVTDRTRVMRAPLTGTSGRTLHVGQPNGMSYSFDSRMLSVRRVWTGGYLNLNAERSARGKDFSSLGKDAKVFIEGPALLHPLTSAGEPVDFEFKEPDVDDYDAIERHLWDPKDFGDKLAELDAEFLGHRIDPGTGQPTFRFRVGENTFSETISISDAGEIKLVLNGELKSAQSFKIASTGLENTVTEGGELADGVWTLPAGAKGPFTLKADLPGGAIAPLSIDAEEDWTPQEMVSRTAKEAQRARELPAGYTLKDWVSPLDLFGRQQLFEPTGIAVAKDGTIVFATRTAGIWRMRDGKWSLFAEGIYEALGVVIEDDKGDVIVIAQKPELTRISDENGDGRAEVFETVCDDFGFHGNYHEYLHGPVRDAEGNYYFLLNLSHYQEGPRVSWRAGGKFMGSMGGYRGWACRVTPEGEFQPYAMGLRSPAGIGIAPDGRIWYAENQGEYVGSSKLVPLEKDKFYGHISGLVSLPGMRPDSEELAYDLWKDKLRKGAVWLPHGIMANSPGNLVWDQTDGGFGPYEGQIFIGDQTRSQVMRVVTERVDGQDQGAVIPFARGLSSGVMRPVFLPDGSLLLGQTGRGWGSHGGSQAALQQIIYDGETVAADISEIVSTASGFEMRFTRPIAKGFSASNLENRLKVESWFYTNLSGYGSERLDRHEVTLEGLQIAPDRRSVRVDLEGFGQGEKWLDRLYHLKIEDTASVFGDAPVWKTLEGYYTLRAIPKE